MGKPSAPKPPDYAAAATAQGTANENAAIASNYLNQANQVGPYGSLTYSYQPGITLADGTVVPQATATTTLSPAQQQLLDQNNQMASQLNQAALQGIGYVTDTASHPLDLSKLPKMATTAPGVYQAPTIDKFNSARDEVTNAYMQRLQPQMDQQKQALDAQLASQGIELGSKAYTDAQDQLARSQNDQRTAALLSGDQAVQNLFQNAMAAGQLQFNQGLAGDQFVNQARNQALQEQEFLRQEPLNILNALRTGNQASLPTFGNVSAGNNIQAAPIYQATADQYAAAQNAYQNKMANYSSLLGGLGSIGGAAIMASDPSLKSNVELIGVRDDGLGVYRYIIFGREEIGVMADEVAIHRPDALGPFVGYTTVNYGVL